MPKIRFDIRQQVLNLFEQLQREQALEDSVLRQPEQQPGRCIVSVPSEVVEAIRSIRSKLT